MSIGENNDTWTGTITELCDILTIGYEYKHYISSEYPSTRVTSTFSVKYIKRNKIYM